MNQSDTPISSDDVILLLGCVTLGTIFLTGGGRFSLDAVPGRRKAPES